MKLKLLLLSLFTLFTVSAFGQGNSAVQANTLDQLVNHTNFWNANSNNLYKAMETEFTRRSTTNQVNQKADTNNPTIHGANFYFQTNKTATANRVLVTGGSGQVTNANASPTEVDYLVGANALIQTNLDSKLYNFGGRFTNATHYGIFFAVGGISAIATNANVELASETITSGIAQASIKGYASGTNVASTSTYGAYIEMRDKSGTNNGHVGIIGQDNGGSAMAGLVFEIEDPVNNVGGIKFLTRTAGSGMSHKWSMGNAGDIYPATDNPAAADVGTTSKRVNDIRMGGYTEMSQMTAPGAPVANAIRFYAEDGGGTSEAKVIDEAGNITQLSAHPKNAPPAFYWVTNHSHGMPKIARVENLFSGTVSWQNETMLNLLRKWELQGTNISALPAGVRAMLAAGTFQEESFPEYNARMGFTNGHPKRVIQLDWQTVQDNFQLDYNRARTNAVAALEHYRSVKPALLQAARYDEVQAIYDHEARLAAEVEVRPERNVRKNVPLGLRTALRN
jgi:hypothetical protein